MNVTETISLTIRLLCAEEDIRLDHCEKHNEWWTGGCQQCTVDLMEIEKQERYQEGYNAGKQAAAESVEEAREKVYQNGYDDGKAAK